MAMALTKTQITLLEGLKAFQVPKDQTIGIMLFLQNDEQGMQELINYMASERPTAYEIIKESVKIVTEKITNHEA